MKETRDMEGQGAGEVPVRPYVEPPSFGRIFKKHGVYDGKLFQAAGKVTYTFVAGREVVSLHFDQARRTIFYKGHNISNMELTQEELHHLEQFRHAIERNTSTKPFVSDFGKVLQSVLKGEKTP